MDMQTFYLVNMLWYWPEHKYWPNKFNKFSWLKKQSRELYDDEVFDKPLNICYEVLKNPCKTLILCVISLESTTEHYTIVVTMMSQRKTYPKQQDYFFSNISVTEYLSKLFEFPELICNVKFYQNWQAHIH